MSRLSMIFAGLAWLRGWIFGLRYPETDATAASASIAAPWSAPTTTPTPEPNSIPVRVVDPVAVPERLAPVHDDPVALPSEAEAGSPSVNEGSPIESLNLATQPDQGSASVHGGSAPHDQGSATLSDMSTHHVVASTAGHLTVDYASYRRLLMADSLGRTLVRSEATPGSGHAGSDRAITGSSDSGASDFDLDPDHLGLTGQFGGPDEIDPSGDLVDPPEEGQLGSQLGDAERAVLDDDDDVVPPDPYPAETEHDREA